MGAFELWYIGRIVEIVARYGRDQLLAIAVPIDEIQRPIIELRNRTLFYSIAFAVFVLTALCDADRRLDRLKAWARPSAVTRSRMSSGS